MRLKRFANSPHRPLRDFIRALRSLAKRISFIHNRPARDANLLISREPRNVPVLLAPPDLGPARLSGPFFFGWDNSAPTLHVLPAGVTLDRVDPGEEVGLEPLDERMCKRILKAGKSSRRVRLHRVSGSVDLGEGDVCEGFILCCGTVE